MGESELALTRREIIANATTLLRKKLYVGKRTGLRPVVQSVAYRSPALIMEPREDNLHLVRMPPLNFDADHALICIEHLFDKVVNPDLSYNLGWKRILKSELASKMIKRATTNEEVVITILWMFSQFDGFDLEYDCNKCILHTPDGPRGLFDNALISNFKWDFKPKPINPKAFLTRHAEPKTCRTWDMVTAYNAAKWIDKKGYLQDVLAILYESMTAAEFRNLMINQPTIPNSMVSKLEKLIFQDKDPYTKVFKFLVPRWMGPADFERYLGVPHLNEEEFDAESRSVLYNRLISLPFVSYKE